MLAAQIPIVQWGSICTTGWEGEEGGGETMEFKMAAGGSGGGQLPTFYAGGGGGGVL